MTTKTAVPQKVHDHTLGVERAVSLSACTASFYTFLTVLYKFLDNQTHIMNTSRHI